MDPNSKDTKKEVLNVYRKGSNIVWYDDDGEQHTEVVENKDEQQRWDKAPNQD